MFRLGPCTSSLRLSLIRYSGAHAAPALILPVDSAQFNFPLWRFEPTQLHPSGLVPQTSYRWGQQSMRIRIRRPDVCDEQAIERLRDQVLQDMFNRKNLFNLTDKDSSNRMCTISGKVAVTLAVKIFEKEGVERTIEFLDGCKSRRVLSVAPPSTPEANQISDALIRTEIVQSPDIFLDECVNHNFGVAYASWASKSQSERSVAGANRLLDYVMQDQSDLTSVREDRIRMVVKLVQGLRTPATALAEVSSACLRADRAEDAEALVRHFVIKPRNFVHCVKRLREEAEPRQVERFARLLTNCYFAEVNAKSQAKARARGAQKEVKAVSQVAGLLPPPEGAAPPAAGPEPQTLGQMAFLIEEARSRRARKKFVLRKRNVKKHEVDPKQLDLLTRILTETWIGCAVERADTDSLGELFAWTQTHRIPVRPHQLDTISALYDSTAASNPFKVLMKPSAAPARKPPTRTQLQGLF